MIKLRSEIPPRNQKSIEHSRDTYRDANKQANCCKLELSLTDTHTHTHTHTQTHTHTHTHVYICLSTSIYLSIYI